MESPKTLKNDFKKKDKLTVRSHVVVNKRVALTPYTLSALFPKARLSSYCKTLAVCLLSFSLLIVRQSYALQPQEDSGKPDFNLLADAIYRAEGGRKASRPYGIMYKGCDWAHPEYCRQICLNTLRNTYKRYLKALPSEQRTFWVYLRDRYAPLSDSPLNANWLPNVLRLYDQIR